MLSCVGCNVRASVRPWLPKERWVLIWDGLTAPSYRTPTFHVRVLGSGSVDRYLGLLSTAHLVQKRSVLISTSARLLYGSRFLLLIFDRPLVRSMEDEAVLAVHTKCI